MSIRSKHSWQVTVISMMIASLLMAGCTTQITQDSFFPRNLQPHEGAAFTAPDGYVLEDALIDIPNMGVVHAVRLDNPASEDTLIFSNGNTSFIATSSRRVAQIAASTDADIILYDYPGRGGSTIDATPDALIEFSKKFATTLRAKNWVGQGKLVSYGLSFGGAVASAIAAHSDVDGLIIEGSADDYAAIGKDFVPGLARPFIKLKISPELQRFDYFSQAVNANAPVLLIAGDQDKIIRHKRTEEFAQRLQDAGVHTKFSTFSGGHGDGLKSATIRDAMREFIETLPAKNP